MKEGSVSVFSGAYISFPETVSSANGRQSWNGGLSIDS